MKKVTRRDFVKGAAAGAVSAAAGAGVLASCTLTTKAASKTTAPATKAGAKPTFTVMNPRADQDDLDVAGLAPRVSTLAGKTLYLVCQKSSKYDMMPYARDLKKQVPTCNIVFCYNAKTSYDLIVREPKPANDPDWTWASIEDMEKGHEKADAAIVAVGF